MTILWEPNRTAAAAVLRSVADATDVRVVDNLTDAAAWVGYDAEERLVVIGADVPFIDVTAFADYMHTIYPDAVLVLMRHAHDEDVVEEALTAGIVAVVPAGDHAALDQACRRGRELLAERVASHDDAAHEAGEDREGEIVVVFSAKGGSGKTLVSTNLALALLTGAHRVCLVDLDLEFGDAAICLQLAPSRNIADGIDLDLSEEENLTALITSHSAGLDCVLAPINPSDAERIPVALIADVLTRLRTRYDYVVVDTPSQLSEHVLEAFDAADHHVIVTTPEIPSLKNTRLTLDMLDLLDYAHVERSVVLNRADPKCELSVADIESALRTGLRVQLPATQAVPTSINRGIPLVVAAPQHPFTLALREFTANSITGALVPSAQPRRRPTFRLKRRSA